MVIALTPASVNVRMKFVSCTVMINLVSVIPSCTWTYFPGLAYETGDLKNDPGNKTGSKMGFKSRQLKTQSNLSVALLTNRILSTIV